MQREVRMLYQTWKNHRDLKTHTKIRLRREDQLGLLRSFKMQRSMVLQIELSEKARSQNHIPVTEPSTFEEAVKQKEWKEAMMEEYQSIMKNYVWEIVPI
jgi:hypothetical protein